MNIFQCFLTSPPQAWNTQKCKTLPFQNPRHDPPISWIISSTRITAKLPHRPTIENEFHLMLKWSEINPRWHIFDKHMQYHAAEAHIDRNKAATKCRSLGKRRVSEQYSWVSLCCKSLPFFVQNSKKIALIYFDRIIPDDWEDTFKTMPGEVVLPLFCPHRRANWCARKIIHGDTSRYCACNTRENGPGWGLEEHVAWTRTA